MSKSETCSMFYSFIFGIVFVFIIILQTTCLLINQLIIMIITKINQNNLICAFILLYNWCLTTNFVMCSISEISEILILIDILLTLYYFCSCFMCLFHKNLMYICVQLYFFSIKYFFEIVIIQQLIEQIISGTMTTG